MKLKVLTWNISYGFGMGSEGTTLYTPKSRDFYEESLHKISQLIHTFDADLVFLQEVDFDASRSHYLHQLDFISRCSHLLNREEIISWDMPYVPYPGLNPKRHFKKVVSGGGILSKYPLTSIQKDFLPKPRENSNLYNFFYLSRYFQLVNVQVPGVPLPLTLLNLHLEAFSQDNRELHLIKLKDRLLDYSVDIAGGDFNGNLALSESLFTQEWKCITPAEPTFSSQHPTEILDGFIVKNSRIQVLKHEVMNTGLTSDHFAVLMEIEIKN